MNLLRFDEILYVWMLVNTTVVHYNHRVGGRKRLHMVKGTLNECIETGCVERTFNDVAIEDTFLKR